jgi:AraC-like DNA-binding protein
VSSPDRPAAAVIEAGGVYLPASACYPLWVVIRRELDRQRAGAEGGRLRPEVADAVNALRSAALAHVSANGPELRTLTDIDAESGRGPITTADLAGRLGVSERHVRRLAAAEGITSLARGVWRRDDADHLTARSADRCPRPPPYPIRSP